MTTASFSAVSRPPASPEDLNGSVISLRLPLCNTFVAGDMLATSFVMRKLAVQVEITDASVATAAEIYIGWPSSLQGFQIWLQAADYLLVEPSFPYLSFLFQNATKDHGYSSGSVLRYVHDPMLAMAQALQDHLVSDGSVMHPAFMSTSDGMYDDVAAPVQESSEADGTISKLVNNSLADLSLNEWMTCCKQIYNFYPSKLWEIGASCVFHQHLRLSILAYAEAPATARECLALLQDIRASKMLQDEELRALTYTAVRRLYLAEKAAEQWPIPLETVLLMQHLYVEGVLNLDCLVPCYRPLTSKFYYVQGLHGRNTVPMVAKSTGEVRRRLYGLVPWLLGIDGQAFGASPVALYLTGSLLAWALREDAHMDDLETGEPADVDIYCDSVENLDVATDYVASTMQKWFEVAMAPSRLFQIHREAPNPSRRILRVHLEEDFDDFISQPPCQACAMQCDVYVNSVKRVQMYHLPAVRCSLPLLADSEVSINPSCAVALATSLNLDYAVVVGRKTPLQILARKWYMGFSCCLPSAVAQQLARRLETTTPHYFQGSAYYAHCNTFELKLRDSYDDLNSADMWYS